MLDNHALEKKLYSTIKSRSKEFKDLWSSIHDNQWLYEDGIYRFYHGSFKVFSLQETTLSIVSSLKSLLPEIDYLDADFSVIIENGTGKDFTTECNKNWLVTARPIVEAFFHAMFFLEMVVKVAESTEVPFGNKDESQTMVLGIPSCWAAILTLYKIM